MDIRLQEILLIFGLSFSIAVFVASLIIGKFRIFDKDRTSKSADSSPSKSIALITGIISATFAGVCILAFIMTLIRN